MIQNIIDFKDGKYVFEEIEGKGKCLVPYKEPRKLDTYLERGTYLMINNQPCIVAQIGMNLEKLEDDYINVRELRVIDLDSGNRWIDENATSLKELIAKSCSNPTITIISREEAFDYFRKNE